MRLTIPRSALLASALLVPALAFAQTPAPASPMALEAEADQRALEAAVTALRAVNFTRATASLPEAGAMGGSPALPLVRPTTAGRTRID
jgi:hypothetical protein